MGRRRRHPPVPTSSTGDAFTHGDALELEPDALQRESHTKASKRSPRLVLLRSEPMEATEPDAPPSCFEIRIFLRPERRSKKEGWRIEDGMLSSGGGSPRAGESPDPEEGVPGGHSGLPAPRRYQPQYLRPGGSASSVPERPPSTSFSPSSDRSAPPTHFGRGKHSALKPGPAAPRRWKGATWGTEGGKSSTAPLSSGSHAQAVSKAQAFAHTHSLTHAQRRGESTWGESTSGVPSWTSNTEQIRAYCAASGLYGRESGLYGRELSALVESPVLQSARTGGGEEGDTVGGAPWAGAEERAGKEGAHGGHRGWDEERSANKSEGYAVGRLRNPGAHRVQPLWVPPSALAPRKDIPGPFPDPKPLAPKKDILGYIMDPKPSLVRGPGVSPGREGALEGSETGPSMRTLVEEAVHAPTREASGAVSHRGPAKSTGTGAGGGAGAGAGAGTGAGAGERAKGEPAPATAQTQAGNGLGQAVDGLVGKMLVHESESAGAPGALPRTHNTAADTTVGIFGSSAPQVTSRTRQQATVQKPHAAGQKPQAVNPATQAKDEDRGGTVVAGGRSQSEKSKSVAALMQQKLARVEENDRRLGIRDYSSGTQEEPRGRAATSQIPKPGEGRAAEGVRGVPESKAEEGVRRNPGFLPTPSSLDQSGEILSTPSVAGSRAGPYISHLARTSAEKVMSWQDAFVPGSSGGAGNSPLDFVGGQGVTGASPASVAGRGAEGSRLDDEFKFLQKTPGLALAAPRGSGGTPKGPAARGKGGQTGGTHQGALSHGDLRLDTRAKPILVPSPVSVSTGTGGAGVRVAEPPGASAREAGEAVAQCEAPLMTWATIRRGGVGPVPRVGEWKRVPPRTSQ